MKKYFVYILILIAVSPITSFGATSAGYHIDKNVNLIPNDPKGNKKVLLITIDDGPSKYSKDIVATLQKHNARAIFFINGTHHKANKDNIAFISKSGFAVGNHTWNHINIKKEKNLKKVKKEIEDNAKLIQKETGSSPKFFRAPFGVNTPYVKNLVKTQGMISMNWSGSALDWEKSARDEKVFIKNVMEGLHDGEILLLHEHQWTSKYLDGLLSTLEKKGYSFLDPKLITE